MADVIAIANEKGGTGKTVTAVNLSAFLAASGFRVLLVDADPQANATLALGFNQAQNSVSLYHVLIGKVDGASAIRRTAILALDLLPSSADLAGASVDLMSLKNRETRLKDALNPLRSIYDFILVDCPPSLGILTINALSSADFVLVPVDLSIFAVDGFRQLIKTLDLMRENLNLSVKVLGAFITMKERRSRLARLIERELRASFEEHLLMTSLPRSVHIAEAALLGKPVLQHAPDSSGSRAYRLLANEVLERLKTSV